MTHATDTSAIDEPFRVRTLNRIAPEGLSRFPSARYLVADDVERPHAILLRSYDLRRLELPPSLLAVGRAGIGIDNVPVADCSARGIVVFTTPGANANAVKELVMAGLLISSRRILRAAQFVATLKGQGDRVAAFCEKEKKTFAGPELMGKTLGVVGLGAIGTLVANDALALGMSVIGFDPFMSVEAAWNLSRDVRRAPSLAALFAQSDFVSLHLPLTDQTRGLVDASRIGLMKRGVGILNFARGEIVDNAAMVAACKTGQVARYVTDFAADELIGVENIICLPHLGASTPEAELNCAVMIVDQVRAYLENGNIRNSVNFPDCALERSGKSRIVIANRNIPNMLGQISAAIAAKGLNIAEMLNRSKADCAMTIVDTDDEVDDGTVGNLQAIHGVVMVRVV